MEPAPFHSDLAEGPAGGAAVWATTKDGLRIRIGYWPTEDNGGNAGTIFLFPGRSEYIEKYGHVARDLSGRGWHLVTVDWRGQGLADRMLDDPMVGHVARFSDYQRDVAELIAFATARDLPQPWMLIGHSMGGCIALRTISERDCFAAVAFSAPMWGINIAPALRSLSRTVPRIAERLGFGGRYAPTTGGDSYLLSQPFDDNVLTTDRAMWNYMKRQVSEVPRFRLGGPSLTWLAEALSETRMLVAAPRPKMPAHVSVGALEKIVDAEAIGTVATAWLGTTHEVVAGAEHELMMERREVREGFLARADALFRSA
ncbi:MAG: alpha/beta hydrolase [Pseudomonadota bacterium]